jgi:hypothetical protein
MGTVIVERMGDERMDHTSDASAASLIRGAMDDARELIREEIALARAELRAEANRVSAGGIRLGMGGVLLMFAATLLLVAISLGIAALFDWPAWAGFGIVAIVLAIGGAIFASSGRSMLRRVETLPRTKHTIKENFQ